MKLKTSLLYISILAIALMMVGYCGAVQADDRVVTGSVGIETPVGMTPDRVQDDSPQVKLNITLKNFIGPFNLFGGGLVATRKGEPWSGENRFQAGLELPIGDQGLLAYSYFERRFNRNDNRVVAGVRYNFRGAY
jgi:hypothetical protein